MWRKGNGDIQLWDFRMGFGEALSQSNIYSLTQHIHVFSKGGKVPRLLTWVEVLTPQCKNTQFQVKVLHQEWYYKSI